MVDSIKSKKSQHNAAADESDDRDDPFDSDVTSEEDDDLMPEREDPEPMVNRVIQQELAQQEDEVDRLVKEELARSNETQAADLLPSRQDGDNDNIEV